MGWLSGWAKRVKFTIVDAELTADLSAFPTLLYLSTSSGTGAEDVSFIFDELGANSLKIAVTNSDGTTQNYVEVEQWDNVNEKAWIWAALTLTNGQDNDFYLYYDNMQADNTTYIGDDPNDAASNSVWDANFMMVHHLQGAALANLDDSTSLNHDMNAATGTPVYNYDSKIGHGIWFDVASSESVSTPDAADLDGFSEATWECWFNLHSLAGAGVYRFILAKWDTALDQRSWFLCFHNDGVNPHRLRFSMTSNGTNVTLCANYLTLSPTLDTWYHLVIRWDKATETRPVLYVNGVATAWTGSDTSATLANDIFPGTAVLGLGAWISGTKYWDGILDEPRISNLDRGAAYALASYETQRDNFVDWATAENAPSGAMLRRLLVGVGLQVDVWNLNKHKLKFPRLTPKTF